MFATLMESGGRRKTQTRWLPASALVHLLLLVAALAHSPQAHGRRADPPETPTLVWVAPPRIDVPRTSSSSTSGGSGTPQAGARRMPRFSDSPIIDMPDLASAGTQPDLGNAGLPVTDFGGREAPPGSSGAGDGPRWAAQVEKVALPLPGNSVPDYPGVLRSAGIEGSVTLRFVIDTAGAVERGSAVVLRTDHTLFTAAALKALATHRFLPAEAGAIRVRMLVEQRFEFALGRVR